MQRGLAFLIFPLLVLLVACSGEESGESGGQAKTTGPALVMFYTDN
jgi:hypothetical protein